MGLPIAEPRFDRAAYFEWEAARDDKHEYLAGEVFARAPLHQEHVLVAGTLAARLREHLRGTRCRAYVSDMKLEIADADAVFYPDVMVSCDEGDRRASLALQAPCLVAEVLSDSTAATDRGPKFAAYRQVAALRDYLLVGIDARRLELFTREPDGWLLHESTTERPWVALKSIGLRLEVAQVFEDLDEAAAGPAPSAA